MRRLTCAPEGHSARQPHPHASHTHASPRVIPSASPRVIPSASPRVIPPAAHPRVAIMRQPHIHVLSWPENTSAAGRTQNSSQDASPQQLTGSQTPPPHVQLADPSHLPWPTVPVTLGSPGASVEVGPTHAKNSRASHGRTRLARGWGPGPWATSCGAGAHAKWCPPPLHRNCSTYGPKCLASCVSVTLRPGGPRRRG
jgi:hypothetical protein